MSREKLLLCEYFPVTVFLFLAYVELGYRSVVDRPMTLVQFSQVVLLESLITISLPFTIMDSAMLCDHPLIDW